MAQTNVLKLNAASNKPAARQGKQAATRKAAATIASQFRRQHIAAAAVAALDRLGIACFSARSYSHEATARRASRWSRYALPVFRLTRG